MLPSSITIADEYWAAELGCDCADLRPRVPRIQQHAGGLRDYSGVYFMTLASTPLVSVPSSLFEPVSPRANHFVVEAVRNPETLTRLLAPASVTKIIGPALLNYADRSCFLPVSTEHTRQLTSEDLAAFDDLKSACSPEDWDPKGFSLDSNLTFGAFATGGELMAAANIRVWAERIAHISIVARPDSRGRGFGTRAVAAVTERALEMGLLPQYRVLEDNVASRRVAEKLGFRPYGWTLAVRLA